jgi:hypothetical protein
LATQKRHASNDQERNAGNDLPMKAPVWQDDQGNVWLTYNTSEYNAKCVLPRHGLTAPDDASRALETFLTRVTDLSTQ